MHSGIVANQVEHQVLAYFGQAIVDEASNQTLIQLYVLHEELHELLLFLLEPRVCFGDIPHAQFLLLVFLS